MEAGKRGAHVSVKNVCVCCFVLFSRVVLFTLERKFSSVVYVCMCVCLVGSHQPNLDILLTLSHCKLLTPAAIRAGRAQPPWSEGSAVRGSAQRHGVAFFPEEARRKSELKNPHPETLGAL